MRVLHITEAPLGGVVSCMEELLAAQTQSPAVEAIAVVTPTINLEALGADRYAQVAFIPYLQRRGSPLSLLRLALATAGAVRAHRPDVVHVHSTIAGAVVRACLGWRRRRPAIVYCPHGWAFSRRSSRAVTWAVAKTERLLSRLCDAVICVSRQERSDAQAIGIDPGRCVVIENGVRMRSLTLPLRLERSDARKVVVFAGRFDRQKGFDVFLQVLRRLGEEAQGYALGRTIVSDEVIEDVPANVELLGWRDRDGVLETFRRSDLLLMPSRWEGLPVVALEAMQAELAVFASRVGGLQDVVEDGETGRLFDLDDVEGIVGMILGTDIDTLERYGRQGRERYEQRYTAERMSRLTLDLYRSLLHRGGEVPQAAREL